MIHHCIDCLALPHSLEPAHGRKLHLVGSRKVIKETASERAKLQRVLLPMVEKDNEAVLPTCINFSLTILFYTKDRNDGRQSCQNFVPGNCNTCSEHNVYRNNSSFKSTCMDLLEQVTTNKELMHKCRYKINSKRMS